MILQAIGRDVVGRDGRDRDAGDFAGGAIGERGGLTLEGFGELREHVLVDDQRDAAGRELFKRLGIVVVAMGVGDENAGRGGQGGEIGLGRIDIEHGVAELESEARMHHRVDGELAR